MSSITRLQNQVKNAEVKFAAFIAEHNLPFSAALHADLFKSTFPDSKIAAEFKCKKTKTSTIIKNVLGETNSQEFNVILQEKKFSIIIDESTDHETIKHLCIVARYFDDNNSKVRDRFLTLLPLQKFDHQTIYNRIFSRSKYSYKENMIGVQDH